jgi:chaperone required for assembly of F1-ATPase
MTTPIENRLNEKRPRPNMPATSGGDYITLDGRQVRCPYREPLKVALWIEQRRKDPALRHAERGPSSTRRKRT